MWEERYSASDDYFFGKAPAQVLIENPGWLKTGATALSVADGEGRNAVYLAERSLAVTAFDLSQTAVGRARDLALERGVTVDFNQSDWQSWDWEHRTFDLVVAIFIQFAPPVERVKQFRNLRQAVRPGGALLLHGYRPEQVALGTGGPTDPSHMYTVDLLQESFGDWSIERLAGYERDVQEGRRHSGQSALIDLMVRRP